jgi:uncharacterized membrane protein YphA (DoxX/SURF4 family)
LFLLSGAAKLAGPETFIHEVDKLNFLGGGVTPVLAYGLVAFELALGLLLVFRFKRWLVPVVIGVMTVFCCYLGFKIYVNDPSDCGCFGNLLRRSNVAALVQNLFILMGAVYLYEGRPYEER